MGREERTTYIAAEPKVVFDFVADIDRWPEWDAFAEEILEASHRPIELGSTYRERDGKDESDWVVTEFDPPHFQVHVGQVPFLGEVVVELELVPRDHGTELRHAVSYEVMPGVRPLGWLIEKVYVDGYARRRMRRTHADAKRLIEAEQHLR